MGKFIRMIYVALAIVFAGGCISQDKADINNHREKLFCDVIFELEQAETGNQARTIFDKYGLDYAWREQSRELVAVVRDIYPDRRPVKQSRTIVVRVSSDGKVEDINIVTQFTGP